MRQMNVPGVTFGVVLFQNQAMDKLRELSSSVSKCLRANDAITSSRS